MRTLKLNEVEGSRAARTRELLWTDTDTTDLRRRILYQAVGRADASTRHNGPDINWTSPLVLCPSFGKQPVAADLGKEENFRD